jgi:transposase
LRFAVSGGWRAVVVAWWRAVPDEPGLPSAEELAVLPHGVLAERLAEAYRVIAQLTAQVREMAARVEEAVAENGRLAARLGALERRAGKDSSTSSKPPSSDSPYKKKPRDRSLREKGERAPGKQPGEPGTTMRLVDGPAHRFWYPPAECRGCGADLSGQEIFAQRRHQVTDIKPAPPPEVTEHVAQSKMCPCCGTVSEGELPAGVRARAGYGPEAHAQAALLTCGNYIPVGRAAELMAQLAGLRASAGWTAGVRAKAAALVDSSGFMDLVAGLLRQAEAVHADETPARAAGGLRYVHLACTRWLTHMHTGDRSAPAVDAGGVLPGYTGIIVRDGYHGGYGHLTGALHAWCGAHLLRDLRDLYQFEPGKQDWAEQMAGLLIEARDAARAARAEGEKALDPAAVSSLTSRYRAIAGAGLAANVYRRTATAGDARRIARRFIKHEDMILRFITRPDLDIFTNNEAERTLRPAKVQQRSSGGCWRTLDGLADFAVVQSYLSTATKWGITKLDALRGLFNGHPWMPPGLEPGTG